MGGSSAVRDGMVWGMRWCGDEVEWGVRWGGEGGWSWSGVRDSLYLKHTFLQLTLVQTQLSNQMFVDELMHK